MITIEEKIRAFEEVGLKNIADKYRRDKENKEMVEGLTKLNFRPITENQIRKMICSKRYKSDDWLFKEMLFDSDLVIPFASIFFSIVTFGLFPLITYFVRYKKPVLDSMSLMDWKENVPYGAALAVKEAKEAGIKHFRIYFPSTKKGYLRRHDPVIVGYAQEKNVCAYKYVYHCDGSGCQIKAPVGSMYEVFSWDDSKVYD